MKRREMLILCWKISFLFGCERLVICPIDLEKKWRACLAVVQPDRPYARYL